MPLALPNLDDRTFDDLCAEALARIPPRAPAWTNHNPSDPGITLVELFAYLSEMLIYRINRITDEQVFAFLTLIDGAARTRAADQPGAVTKTTAAGPVTWPSLAADVDDALSTLRRVNRAVTAEDFEQLARQADARVARAHAHADPGRPAHVSVLIVPFRQGTALPRPSPDLLARVHAFLDPRRLIATKVDVVGPRFVKVGVKLTLHVKADALPARVTAAAGDTLKAFFDPVTGGPAGTGWPLGRSVYVSEVYERLVDTVAGLDYVTTTDDHAPVTVDSAESPPPASGRLITQGGALVGVRLDGDELVDAEIRDGDLTVIAPQAPRTFSRTP